MKDENVSGEEKELLNDVELNNDSDGKNKKKISKITIIIIVMTIIIVVLGCVIGFLLLKKDDKKVEPSLPSNNIVEEDEDENIIEEPVKIEKELSVYSCSNGGYSAKKYDTCNEVAFTINVEDEDGVLYTNFKDTFLYKDVDLKLYDNSTKKTTTLNMDSSYQSYQFITINDGDLKNTIVGIFALSGVDEFGYPIDGVDLHSAFYNIETGSTMYVDKYSYLYSTNVKEYIAGGVGEEGDMTVSLLSSTREKVIKSFDDICGIYNVEEYNGIKYIFETTGCIGEGNSNIYSEDGTLLVPSRYASEYYIDDNGYIYYFTNDIVFKIDSKKKELIRKNYKNIMMISLNYVIYYEDDKVYISNIDGDNKIELCEYSDNYYFHTMISGYRDDLDEDGIYLMVSYDREDTDESKAFEVIYDIKTGNVTREELDYIGGYGKPVLYLYPEEITDVTVNFEYEDRLTTTYPKFVNEWKVTANPNGDLYDKDGKYYYGLYWEEDLNHDITFNTGFYVTKDNAIEFLEEKLSIIGLNDKERNEFIMYWLPILEKNGKNLVYFELTEERDMYNKINISPKPDSLLRVAIHVKKVDKKVNIREQKLTSFNRNGFVAVEWGGVIH